MMILIKNSVVVLTTRFKYISNIELPNANVLPNNNENES